MFQCLLILLKGVNDYDCANSPRSVHRFIRHIPRGAFFTFRITHNYKATIIVFGSVFLFSVAYGLAGMLE